MNYTKELFIYRYYLFPLPQWDMKQNAKKDDGDTKKIILC